MTNIRESLAWSFVFFLVLILILLLFWPGASGGFIFDDYINIGRLEDFGCIENTHDLLRFIFGGGNVSGRPLANLSFLLHDLCWSGTAEPFKKFNVLWHLLNACLVIALALKIFQRLGLGYGRASWLALMVGFVWAVHPIHVSTVFLTVQRMTLMMSTCILLGLLLYIKGRPMVESRPLCAYTLMAGGLFVAGAIGSLFKEVAVGVPFYVLSLEVTLFAAFSRRPAYLWWPFVLFCLVLPILAVVVFSVLDPGGSVSHNWMRRDFSLLERLMTEARVLMVYLRQIVLPDLSFFGIFHGDFLISRSLVNPWTTLPAILAVVASIFFSLMRRKKNPLLALGILWFFGGHALEATILPIELYYEHRNYLPALGVAFFAIGILQLIVPSIRRWLYVYVTGMLILFAFFTWELSHVWGQPLELHRTEAQEHPGSYRAQIALATELNKQGHKQAFVRMLYDLHDSELSNTTVELLYLGVVCPDPVEPQVEKVRWMLRNSRLRNGSLALLSLAVKGKFSCERLTPDRTRKLIRAALSNPSYTALAYNRRVLYGMYAVTYKNEGKLNLAMYFMDQAYEAFPVPDDAFSQAVWLLSAGLEEPALKYAKKALDTPEHVKLIKLDQRPDYVALYKELKRRVDEDDSNNGSDSGKE